MPLSVMHHLMCVWCADGTSAVDNVAGKLRRTNGRAAAGDKYLM
jgi:hypothetical protein